MMDMKWTDAMTVEVDELDEDHRIIFAHFSELGSAIERREAGPALSMFDDLLRITRVHFAREERMLADCEFPMLALHVNGHREAEKQLLTLQEHLEGRDWSGARSAYAASCDTFLFRLILDDLDYKLFLQDKDIMPRFSGLGVIEWLPRSMTGSGGVKI